MVSIEYNLDCREGTQNACVPMIYKLVFGALTTNILLTNEATVQAAITKILSTK